MIQQKLSRILALSAIAITSGFVLVTSWPIHRLLAVPAEAAAVEAPQAVPVTVERLDPALDLLVPAHPWWRR